MKGSFVATVTLENITKTYRAKRGEIRAVDDLSLAVADREFVVLVGPSGCGKTTTLRLVAGLEGVDAGTIRIGERVVNDVAPKDRDIAMVFQNYALYPHMTVFKNMGFGLKMRRTPKSEIKRKVQEAAAMLGIEHLLDRKPAALSGGEQQRVAVGRAIVRRPRVFLFDEPLSNLDAKLRVHMRTEIRRLHQEIQTTIIYVTHDQGEAMTLGNRLVIMDKGVVQQRGAPLDIYNRPANRFVAGFVGTPPMNFLDGRIEGDGDRLCFSGPPGRFTLPVELGRALKPYHGQAVILGVRPEHIRLDQAEMQSADPQPVDPRCLTPSIQASIAVVEPLGDSINVHLAAPGGEKIVARVSPTVSVAPGQSVNATVDMSHAHVFSAGSMGQRLN